MNTVSVDHIQKNNAFDLLALINDPARNLRRRLVVAICFAIVAIEGFDAAIIGFVAPQVAAQFGATPTQMSMAISAGMLGLMLGYMLGGPLSDKRGRHPVLLIGTAVFGIASVGTAFSNSLTEVILWRLATGIGIGAAMPALSALLGEIIPNTRRASTLSGVFCGFLFGSALAGILTGHLIESVGWKGMFIVGGIAPLLCLPAIWALIPESPLYLAETGQPQNTIRQALAKIGLSLPTNVQAFGNKDSTQSSPGSIRTLVEPQLRQTTILVWLLMFLVLGSFYVIASWLPTLLKAQGAEMVDVSLPQTELSIPAYYVLASAEASTNLSRYDGVRYGHRAAQFGDLDEMYSNTRAEGFGSEVKRRIMMGTYVLSHGYYDAYYLKAQKLRRLVANDFQTALQSCDLILGPVAPTAAPKLGSDIHDPVQMYLSDIYTIALNLAGLPGMSLPAGFSSDGLPIGVQLIGNYFTEAKLLGVAHQIQQHSDWHSKVPA